MKTFKISVITLACALTLGSCASKKDLLAAQQKYQEAQQKYDNCQNENKDLLVSLAEYKTKSASLENQVAEKNASLKEMNTALQAMKTSLDNSINQGGANISKLVDEINASNKYIKQLIEAKSKSDSLNMALTNRLTRSLSKEELKDVDVQVLKGVVYISLNDNMLYKSGSYEISEAASETLSKIAKIITDNVPIKKTNIRNNWDLSALRASSVVQELQNKYGVNPSRLSAAGRGEYNPVSDNDTAEGRAKNRRTQIIITPKLDQFLDLIDKAPEAEE